MDVVGATPALRQAQDKQGGSASHAPSAEPRQKRQADPTSVNTYRAIGRCKPDRFMVVCHTVVTGLSSYGNWPVTSLLYRGVCGRNAVDGVMRAMRPQESEKELGSALTIGDLELDPNRAEVRTKGVPVALTRKEFAVLWSLVADRGRVTTRNALLRRVWGREVDANPRTVDVYIRRLRAKLERTTGCRIETVVNVGYKLVLPQP